MPYRFQFPPPQSPYELLSGLLVVTALGAWFGLAVGYVVFGK